MHRIYIENTFKVTVITLFSLILTVSCSKRLNKTYLVSPYVKALYAKPITYDPAQMNDTASLIVSELIYDGLLKYDESYGVISSLASSWSTSESGLEIRFTLKKAKFHSGDAIKSSDVKRSFERLVSPSSQVYKYYEYIEGAKEFHLSKSNSLTGIKILNDQQLIIKLVKPYPPFLYVLAGGTAKILPHIKNENTFFNNPIGSGAYKLARSESEKIRLESFDLYYGNKPHIQNLHLVTYDQDKAMQEAKNGSIHDLASWPMNGSEEVFKVGKTQVQNLAETWIIGLNSRIKPFDNIKVRRAFKASIDSREFRDKFYSKALVAKSYIPHGFPGSISKQSEKVSDLSVPKHSLIKLYIPKELSQSKEIASYFQEDLTGKGWKVKVELLAWQEMMTKYNSKELASFLLSMVLDYPDSDFLYSNFTANNPDNFSGLRDSTFDKLVLKSRSTQDRLERHKIYNELSQIIESSALAANLIHVNQFYWTHKCVRGFKPNPLAVSYIDYSKVYLDSDCMRSL